MYNPLKSIFPNGLRQDNVLVQAAPMLNPLGFARGLGHALNDVFGNPAPIQPLAYGPNNGRYAVNDPSAMYHAPLNERGMPNPTQFQFDNGLDAMTLALPPQDAPIDYTNYLLPQPQQQQQSFAQMPAQQAAPAARSLANAPAPFSNPHGTQYTQFTGPGGIKGLRVDPNSSVGEAIIPPGDPNGWISSHMVGAPLSPDQQSSVSPPQLSAADVARNAAAAGMSVSPLSSLPLIAQQNMQGIQQGLADGSIIAGADHYIYPGQQSQQGQPAPQDPMALINGLAPQQSPQTLLAQGYPQQQFSSPGYQGQGQAPGTMPPVQSQTQAPDMGSLLRQTYADQLANSSAMADSNLRYMQNDLNRRSQRDNSDDFFGSVVAPIAGGMAKDHLVGNRLTGYHMTNNMASANAMGDKWMGQAQERRGERMNLVNSLIGRQNRAQEYLQATDPSNIKNQISLWDAQTRANNSMYKHLDNMDGNQVKRDGNDIKRTANEQLNGYRQSLINLSQQRVDELVKSGQIKQDMADSIIRKNEAFIEDQIADGLRESQKIANQESQFGQTLEEKQREADQREAGMNSRFNSGQTGMDRRLDATQAYINNRQTNAFENANQIKANSLDSKGNPKMNETFINEMKLPPMVRHQIERYRALPQGTIRNAARIAIQGNYGYDPGE